MRLLLIRHGQTPGNVLGQLDTAFPGPGLTELGRSQAEALPRSLGHEEIQALYASRLTRTQLTAAPLATALGLDTQVLDGLQEIEAGDIEKATDHESHLIYMKTVFAWADGRLDVKMPGGTDGHAFFARYDAAIEKIASAGHSTAAIISHGAAIRCWAGNRTAEIDSTFASHNQLANTGVVIVEGEPGLGWKLLHWDQIPIGGMALADPDAEGPTGEAI